MTSPALRLFLALPVDPAIRAGLARAIGELRGGPAKVGWVAPDAMHLTVKFLGETPEERVDGLSAALRPACAALPPPGFALRGAGTFPPRGNPRVVWAGVESPDGSLLRLAETVEKACAAAGFSREKRPFSPHLTLGRVRGEMSLADLSGRVESLASRSFGSQLSPALVLYRSHLSPAGARHEELASFPFSD